LLLFFGYEDKSFELYKKHVMGKRKVVLYPPPIYPYPATDLVNLRPTGHGERRVFTIPVGNLSEVEMEEYVRGVANKFKRDVNLDHLVDPVTGQIDLKFNPLSIDEDIFIPQRPDPPSGILYYVDFKYGDTDVERKEFKLLPSDEFNK
jgi:hypothetical protein